MKYNVLLFDADGTLFDFDAAERIAFRNVLKEFNHEENYDLWFPIYTFENNKIWEELEQGKISQEELKIERFRRFLNKIKLKVDETQFAAQFMSALSNASILFEDAYDVIKNLSKNYKILIVTNGLKEVQQKRIRESVLSPFVLETIISDEINIQKPDPRIIDYALQLIDHKERNDVIIIGDRLTSDIQAGIYAGIDTIWYNPNHKEIIKDMKPTYMIKSLKDISRILD